MRYRVAILGHLPDSSALLIVNDGEEVLFERSESGMEWRDSPSESSLAPVTTLLAKLARTQGLPNSAALMRHVDQVAVAVSGLDARFSNTRFVNAMETAGVPPELLSTASLAEATHLGCFCGEPGILVRCGHGSSAFGKAESKTTALAGGWGTVTGDHGSGAWIGKKALVQVSRTVDRIASEGERLFISTLVDRVADRPRPKLTHPFERMEGLRAVGGHAAVRIYLTKVARAVIEMAGEGDATATDLVDRACEHLVSLADAVIVQLNSGEAKLPVRIGGSLANCYPEIRLRFEKKLQSRLNHGLTVDSQATCHYGPIVGLGLRSLNCFETDEIQSIGARFIESLEGQQWAKPHIERRIDLEKENTTG